MGFLKNFKRVFSKNDSDIDIPQKNDDASSERGTFGYLDDLIHCGQNEIVLDSDIVLQDFEEEKYKQGIAVDVDNLVIDGRNHSIDARGLARIFDVSANVTFKNITFMNGNASDGGAVNVEKGCLVSCFDCSFKDNTSSFSGAAVSIAEKSFLTCRGCGFEANSSNFHGGAVSNDEGSMNFESCIFKNNDSGNDTPEDIEKLKKSNFGKDKVFRSSYSGEGGAVYNSNGPAVFTDCVFEGNVAGCGGAISHYRDELVIKNGTFKSNNANRTDGGVFFNLGKLKVEGSVFERNVAEYHGGVIFNVQTFELYGCEFINNMSKNSNGGVISNNFDEYGPSENDNCLIEDCSFTNNISMGAGAVLDNYKGFLTFRNCVFDKNTANSAGVIINGDRIDLAECVFNNNIAKGYFSEGVGGAICNVGEMNVAGCTLTDNYAEHIAGAIHDEGTLKITGCIFRTNNVGKGRKCAINNWEGSMSIEDSKFGEEIPETLLNRCELEIAGCEFAAEGIILNEATVNVFEREYDSLKNIISGGNIHIIDFNRNAITFGDLKEMIEGADNELILERDVVLDESEESVFEEGIELDADNIIIDGNGHFINANAKASIFKITRGGVVLKNIRFRQAYSGHSGSAISAENASLTLMKCHFENCISKLHGGAVYSSNTELTIDECTFDGNNSTDDGGALYLASGKAFIKNNSVFTGNVSKEDGGALYTLYCPLTVEGCRFEDNESSEDGGAIYNVHASLSLKGCEFAQNTARDGGSLANESENRVDLVNCNFDSNEADTFGGAILNFGKRIILNNCKFKNCSAERGGCIASLKGSTLLKSNCRFANCSSKIKGGAIYNESLSFYIEEAVFTDNSSLELGGAIYNEGSLILDKCGLCTNSSKSKGGAIWSSYNLEVYESKFDANTSNDNGPSIYHGGNEDSILKVSDSSFAHSLLSDGGEIYILAGFALAEGLEFTDFENEGGIAIHNDSAILEVDRPKFEGLERPIYNGHIIYLNRKDGIDEKVIMADGANPIRYRDDDVLPDGWLGFDYLNNMIQNADGHIKLDCDILMHESEQKFYEGGIELNRDGMIIDGNGKTIDANNLSRIFCITARDVTLKNITFKNGKYFMSYLDSKFDGGGAVCALSKASVNIVDCKFLDNVSRRSAGSIVNKGKDMLVEGCEFENSDSQICGGFVLNEGLLNMAGCSFESATANVNGGGLYNHDGTVSAEGCRFGGCAANSGGAIGNLKGSLTLEECEFADCTAGWDGGAIHNQEGSMDLNSGSFHRNNADGNGKKFISSSLVVSDDFEDDTSIEGINGFGGAITNYNGSMNLKNIDFEDNVSKSMAGSIYAYGGSTDLENAIFRGGDENAVLNEGTMAFRNCDFDESHVITNSSFIKKHCENGRLNIKNKMGNIRTIFENKIDDYKFFTELDDLIHSKSKGIVLNSNYILSNDEAEKYDEGIIIDVDDLTIDGNGFILDGNGMSSIFLIKAKNVILKNIKFLNAFSNFRAALNNAGVLSIENCLFQNNSSMREYGGAVYNVGNLNLHGCQFKYNGAMKRAGAVYNEKGMLDVKECLFEDNVSRQKGNAVFNCNGFLTLGDSKFIKDGLETSESAVYNTGSGLITGIDD